MSKRIRWAALAALVIVPILAGLFGIKLLQFQAMREAAAQQTAPVEPVNVVSVVEREWQPRIASVGTVAAVRGTVVSAEADGTVREISFDAGSMVEAGDVLVRLDADVETAQLRAAQANAELARISLDRAKRLIGSRSISQADFDIASATLKQAQAEVDNIRAIIDKKTIRAPFAGRLGIKSISEGQYLTKGAAVVSLQALDPVHVDFSLPQQQLAELTEGLSVVISADAWPDQRFEGRITAINPDVDMATRNVRLQATLPNTDGRLRPGMFVSVHTLLARTERVLFIPATAVHHEPYGDSVFVLEQDPDAPAGSGHMKVQQKIVRLGRRQGDYVIVTEGLSAGDQVVASGVFKLQQGATVVVDNTLLPDFSFTPQPKNT